MSQNIEDYYVFCPQSVKQTNQVLGHLWYFCIFSGTEHFHTPSPLREAKSCPQHFVSRPEACSAGDAQEEGVGEEEERCVTPRHGEGKRRDPIRRLPDCV